MHLEVTFSVQHDEVFAALNRDATQAKQAGDWEAAVALLYKAKAHQGDLYHDTRLAKFLQQSGQLDEALKEIQWLVDRSSTWAKSMFGDQPASVLQRQRVIWLAHIHRDAMLICKRAKRLDLRAEHEKRRDAYWNLLEKLEPLAEADTEARSGEQRRVRQAALVKRKELTDLGFLGSLRLPKSNEKSRAKAKTSIFTLMLYGIILWVTFKVFFAWFS